MSTVHTLVLRAPGANCDQEAAFAFELAGARVQRLHINQVKANPRVLEQFQIMVIPGGFTYGDDIAAGKILAVQLRSYLNESLQRFRDDGKLILGICNGFQALLKAGILIPPGPHGVPATLTDNDPPGFVDRWINMKVTPGKCVFLSGYETLEAPIAHGEGRFVSRDPSLVEQLGQRGQIVLRYADASGEPGPYPANPNGSAANIAGLSDESGRVLGLMPHPERNILPTHHPQWTRRGLATEGAGMQLFRNAVQYFQRW